MGGQGSKSKANSTRGSQAGFAFATGNVTQQFAATSLADRKRSKRKRIVLILFIPIVLAIIYFSLKEQYQQWFRDMEYVGDPQHLALKIVLVRTYPFLKGVFFSNPVTANAVLDWYYLSVTTTISDQGSLPPDPAQYSMPLSCIVNTQLQGGANGVGSMQTVFGLLELNPTLGYDDVWQQCQGKISILGQKGGWEAHDGTICCPADFSQFVSAGISSVFQYVLPIAMMFLMF